MMRRIGSLLAIAAIGLAVLATPASASAAAVGFPYYGGLGGGVPLLPCTGFLKVQSYTQELNTDGTPVLIDAKGNVTTNDKVGNPKYVASGTIQIVDNDATPGFTDADGVVYDSLPQCTSLCDVFTLANNLLIFALSIAITVILPIMIMVGAGYIITGGGNPGQRAQGMKIIQGTIVGVVICVFGFFLVNQVLQLIFGQLYGDALREAANEQATEIGLNPDEIDDLFSWDDISCRPNKTPGVKTSDKDGLAPATAPVKSSTGKPTAPVELPTFVCGNAADQKSTQFTCKSGWKKDARCTAPERPLICTVSASDACYKYCKDQGPGSYWIGQVYKGKKATDLLNSCACSVL